MAVPGAMGDHLPASTTVAGANAEHYEQELNKWVKAYESLSRENEQLRTQSGDTLLIKKWQERYEECLKEKEDLLAKLKVFSRLSEAHHSVSGGRSGVSTLGTGLLPAGSSASHSDRRTPEQMYIDLMDEYKVCENLFMY